MSADRRPDSATAGYLAQVNAVAMPTFDTFTAPVLRQAVKQGRAQLAPQAPDVFSVRGVDIETSAGIIALRLYRPHSGVLPALVYFPGGGWVLGDLDSHDALCRVLANESGCAVIAVDYRKAPENRFPAAVEDAIETLRWIVDHAEELQLDKTRLAIGGDSAGANIATVAAMAIDQAGGPTFAWQLLLYPITHRPQIAGSGGGSYESHGRGYSLTAEAMQWFFDQYAPASTTQHEAPDWWLTPITAPDFSGLPPTLVIVAGCDPLRDEGIAYAETLADAGIVVELVEYHDQIHGFANTGDGFPRSAEVRSEVAMKMRAAIGD